MANVDLRNRAPKVERLPDTRLRITYVYDVINAIAKDPAKLISEVWQAWGTQAPAFPNCRLIKQDVTGQNDGPFLEPEATPPQLIRIFEEIPATAEVQVGNADIEYDQYDNQIVTLEYLQFSAGTAIYQVPGFTPAPAPNSQAILKDESRTDDGTLRVIKRVYSSGGIMADNEELKFGGRLLLRTLKYLNQVPPTPAGYTLITRSEEFVRGLPFYTYGYANGSVPAGQGGVISDSTDYRQSSDQGTTGVTVRTIKYLTDLTVVSNPISTPSGMVLISIGYDDEAGYRVWTGVYAKGIGRVSIDTETKNNGKLILTTIKYLNTDSGSTPSGTLISDSSDASDGYTIVTRTYALGAGRISIDTETKNNGGLIITTVRYLNSDDGALPPGTLIDTKTDQADGYVMVTKTYALGAGRVSTDVQTKNEGKLVLTTIRYFNTDSGGTPAGVVIDEQTEESDGYQTITKVYADGAGRISTTTEEKYNGALTLTNIRYLNTDDGATPPGVLVTTQTDEADGYQVISEQYADGDGEISRDVDYRESADQGTTGLTVTTIRHITAPSGSNPITPPVGSEEISASYTEADGYRIWTGIYAAGAGTVMSEVAVRDTGRLIIYSKKAINLAPSAPSPTIGGSVVLIKSETRNGTDVENGTIIYDYQWAEGEGLVTDEKTIQDSGVLVIYHRRSYGTAPTTPSATIGGTVTLFETSVEIQGGYTVYDYRWAEGKGQASISTSGREDGSIVYTVTDYAVGATTPAYPGSGTAYLVELEQTPANGHYVNRAKYIKPPATTTFKKQVQFRMPGVAYFIGTQLTLQPPSNQDLLADVEVSYGTSQDTSTPFSLNFGTSFNYTYKTTATADSPSQVVSGQDALTDYVSEGISGSGTDSIYNGILCDTWEYATTLSDPGDLPTGVTVIHVDNDLYLTATDGTQVFRRAVTSYDFP